MFHPYYHVTINNLIAKLKEVISIECLFADCVAGMYGYDCSSPCGRCQAGDVCHHVDGRCPGACLAGYRGDKCNQGKSLHVLYTNMKVAASLSVSR